MKIAIVHSMYRSSQPSGENNTVVAQAAQLREAGHEVMEVFADSDNIRHPVFAAARLVLGTGDDPNKYLLSFNPDIVHVHNTFPNFSKRWPRFVNAPIVTTLHNFRYSCAAGTFFRDGKTCYLCVDGSRVASVKHGCYRDSRLATIPMLTTVSRGPQRDDVLQRSSRLIALSPRALGLHQKCGVPAEKLSLIPNFVPVSKSMANSENPNWAYVGRLSPEKGIEQLVDNWPAGQCLDVYGDGPLRSKLELRSGPSIRIHGSIPASEVPGKLAKSRGLIFPSMWAESAYPMSYLDALAASLPVVALSGNAAADDIYENATGVVFERWDGLSNAISEVQANWRYFSDNALTRYLAKFSPSTWQRDIESLYADLLNEDRASQKSTDNGQRRTDLRKS